MTDNTQPEALRLADELEREKWHVPAVVMQAAAEELRRQHARIAELEAQLSAIGAGGVSGPLIGRDFDAADMAAAKAEGFREGAAEMAKLRGQRMVLCSLLGECRPVIEAILQMPGDDASDAHLNGLLARVGDALVAIAEDRVKGASRDTRNHPSHRHLHHPADSGSHRFHKAAAMTEPKQPEALELASAAESADLAGYPTAKKANAYCLCLLEDCAHMIRRLHAENESLRAERERNMDSIRVSNEIINKKNAENTAIQAGYAAARLEIESLRARGAAPDVSGYVSEWSGGLCTSDEAMDGIAKLYAAQPAGAQQPGDERAAFEQWSKVTNQGYDLARNVSGKLQTFESTETEHAWRGFFHGLRASHGQAPAQAAPAAVAGPSEQETHESAALTKDQRDALYALDALAQRGIKKSVGELIAWLDSAAPTAHPAPQQETQSALFDKQGFRAWVLHNLPDDTIIGSSAYWADHLSAWAQRFVKKAPQQEATDALARAEYYIDNPSAWSSFDQRISDDISAVTEALRAALAAPKPQQEAQEQAAVPRFNCWTTNDGDSWFDHPADSQAIYDCLGNDAKVGDEYELTAGWRSVTARYRITEVVGDGEEYEVECLSHKQENTAPQPTSQGDALDAARYRYLTRSMGDYCITHAADHLGGVLKAAAADAAIDAARAAQESKSHGN